MMVVDNMWVRFVGDWVLENVNMQIKPKTIVGITGDRNSGKTTLLMCMRGMCKFNVGSVTINHEFITNSNIRSLIFFVPAYFEWKKYTTVGCTFKGFKNFYPNINEQAILEEVKDVNITKDTLIKDISYSLQYYLAHVMSLNCGCRYIFTDDPFDTMDKNLTFKLKKLFVKAVKNKDCSIVIATKNLSSIEELIDKYYFIKDKKVYSNESFDKLRNECYKFELSYENSVIDGDFDTYGLLDVETKNNVASIILYKDENKLNKILSVTKPISVKEVDIMYNDLFKLRPKGTK